MVDQTSTGEISEAVERLSSGGADARLWIDKVRGSSASVANEADSLIETTRRARLAARRIGGALDRRNCVGVFGPSQAGKSYLVSALARRKDAPLEIDFAGDVKDFLREINPAGDRESTGLVSRFTRHSGEADPEFPVELRLLSEMDLVKIIANSFLSDFDPNNMTLELPDEQAIRDTIRELEGGIRSSAQAADHLDEIELFDLAEYFRQHFRSRVGALDRANYWDAVIRIGGRLPIPSRAKLFALLWGDLQPFTDLFISLAKALEAIGNAPEARAALAGLIPRETGEPPRPNTIIDVAVLSRLNSEEDAQDTVAIKPVHADGPAAPTSLPRATLTALIAEVKLVMVDAPWPFFEHTDLLDFPGARSRLKLNDLPPVEADRDKQLRELFLRGKIAYLFQRYTSELELTAMLLCMPPSVQEVKDLAGMVRSWIDTTHGATPDVRARVKNALFLVLTKFDLEFLEKGGDDADSRRSKWDRRLHASFLELYGKDGWTEDWDGDPFANTVFLRNPGMKQVHLMDYSDVDRLVESGPAAQSSKVIGEYRDAFHGSALVAKHFNDRDRVWDAAMQPNDGGVEYLVERLSDVLDPNLKRRQGTERLLEAVTRLETALKRFHHGDGDDARRKRDERLQEVRKALLGAVRTQEYRNFAHLIDQLQLPETDARGIFFNVAAMREEDLAAEQADDSEDAGGDADPWADDDPWASETADSGEGEAAPLTKRRERPEIFADRVINAWTARLRRFQQDDASLRALGMSSEIVGEIVDDLIVGADRHGLPDSIAESVRAETLTAGARWEDAADRAVRIAAYEINDYVGYLGFGAAPESERPKFPEAPRDPVRSIFSPPPTTLGIEVGKSRALLEREFFVDWGVALRRMGVDNVSHDSGREISDADNRELGRIITTIDVKDQLMSGSGAE
ncbi:virulence factor SrfC family protein [Minwuia sp.]|uniref:virulence factor SrfC family protein n=1 Tax=Minwuia sp. TaxID=2493630 RepID=UPI003A8F60AD